MTTFASRQHPSRSPRLRGALALGLAFLLPASLVAAQEATTEPRPTIVVTTEMLGWVVHELVGDEAEVVVLMRGVDPHAFEPSARDAETVFGADLIVANGLGLEEGLILEQAEADGLNVFEATDHITIRGMVEAEDVHAVEDDHDHGTGDPHFWMDPLAMRDVALALAPALESAGVTVEDRDVLLATGLEALDAEARSILAVVLPERRRLVTGHESIGYLADRYGFELVGTVVPGLSSHGEIAAGELAALVETIRREAVSAIFAEVGTPQSVAMAIADETGVPVVELPTEQLPPDGSYLTFIRDIATRVTEALTD